VIASVVDTGDLWEVVWVSLVAGVSVTAVFGVAILGATRATELRREGEMGAAVAFGTLGLLAVAFVLGAIAFGIIVLVDK
jgi:hypothetical protein